MNSTNRGSSGSKRIPILALAAVVAAGFAGCGDDGGNPTGEQNGNRAPVIDSIRVSVPVTAPADSVQVWCYAADGDGDPLTYTWQAVDGTIVGSGASVHWVAATGNRDHSIAVTVDDGRDGVAHDGVAIEVMEGTLLVQSRDGIVAVGARGESFVFAPTTGSVEVLGSQIFTMGHRSIQEIDHSGEEIRTISIGNPDVNGHDFAMLPGGEFVFAANHSDSVHFMLADGTFVESVPMPNPSPESLQNIDAVVVGSRLILSENGNNELLAFDLNTREASIFRPFPGWGGWLGAIDYEGGLFYLCGGTVIRHFPETGEPEDLATVTRGNITGIVVVGNYAYVVINFDGTLHRIDTRTGADETLVTDLDYPQDIEHLPVTLEPPPGR